MIFGDNTDDITDDVNNNLVQKVMQPAVTKGNVRFSIKATFFLKQIFKDYKLSRLSLKAKTENWGTE